MPSKTPDTITVHTGNILRRIITSPNEGLGSGIDPTIVYTRVTAIEHGPTGNTDIVGFDGIVPGQTASGSRLFAEGPADDSQGAELLKQQKDEFGIQTVFEVVTPESIPTDITWSDAVSPHLKP